MTRIDRTFITRTADVIEREGIAAAESAVAAIVHGARALDLRSVAADVLGDPSEPAVARERAFGKVTTSVLAARTPAPTGNERQPLVVR